jgi:hypothetical protein
MGTRHFLYFDKTTLRKLFSPFPFKLLNTSFGGMVIMSLRTKTAQFSHLDNGEPIARKVISNQPYNQPLYFVYSSNKKNKVKTDSGNTKNKASHLDENSRIINKITNDTQRQHHPLRKR